MTKQKPAQPNNKSGTLHNETGAKIPRPKRGAALVDSPDPENDAPPVDTSPKLSNQQRLQLRRLIIQYHDVGTIQAVLADEYPEFPGITDQLIRYYRVRINRKATEEMKAAYGEIAESGIAAKVTRVAHLGRMYRDLLQLPNVANGEANHPLINQKREILKQVAIEMGDWNPTGTPAKNAAPATDPDDDTDPDAVANAQDELAHLIALLAEEANDMHAAQQAAQRPDTLEDLE